MVGPQVRRKLTTSFICSVRADHCTAHAAALAVEVLGGGVHDDIRPERQRQSAAPGVQKQLSTTSRQLLVPGQAATCAARSATSHRGLDGVSRNSMAVLGRIAARQPASVQQRYETDLHAELRQVFAEQIDGGAKHICASRPHGHRDLSSAMQVLSIAAMPEAVATPASAPSSAASRCSNARTVGLV